MGSITTLSGAIWLGLAAALRLESPKASVILLSSPLVNTRPTFLEMCLDIALSFSFPVRSMYLLISSLFPKSSSASPRKRRLTWLSWEDYTLSTSITMNFLYVVNNVSSFLANSWRHSCFSAFERLVAIYFDILNGAGSHYQ